MNPFTTTLPAADAFGADTKYIAVNATTGEINAPVSAIQITHPKFGLAIRGDWQWALMDPSMAKLLLAGQPAQGAKDDSDIMLLRKLIDRINDHAACAEGNMRIIQQHIELAKSKAENAP